MYPALAVLQALGNRVSDLLWVGSQSGMEERLLEKHQIPFEAIPSAGVHGVDISQLPKNLLLLRNGYYAARRIISKFQPEIIFSTGGYISVPVMSAGRKIPSVIFIPDIAPGLALKTIMPFASKICLSTEKSLRFSRSKQNNIICGYPLRKDIKNWSRKTSRDHFNIPQSAKVLLVFGGSKGARSINQNLLNIVNKLLPTMHILHISGSDNYEEIHNQSQKIIVKNYDNYHLFPFLHDDMGAAFCCADLIICRAGASILGELPYFGVPAILVPYPHAWKYQEQNASFLVNAGAAILVKDEDMPALLLEKIHKLMDKENLRIEMGDKMQTLSIPNAAERIADVIVHTHRELNKGKEDKW